jgi:hypothetical protein
MPKILIQLKESMASFEEFSFKNKNKIYYTILILYTLIEVVKEKNILYKIFNIVYLQTNHKI